MGFSTLRLFNRDDVGTNKTPFVFYEKNLNIPDGFLVAGVDEAGRGPLAGPVLAAAVIFPPGLFIRGVTDSKKLTPEKREALFPLIKKRALAIGLGVLDPQKIDQFNILQASLMAMEKAVLQLSTKPNLVLIDGNHPLKVPYTQKCLIQGDRLSHTIGAASILAKVIRDKLMDSWHIRFPQYNFKKNKGYGTREHFEALKQFGPCPLHRLSFKGVVKDRSGEKNRVLGF